MAAVVPSDASTASSMMKQGEADYEMEAAWEAHRKRFGIVALVLETAFFVLYATQVEYGEGALPLQGADNFPEGQTELDHMYPWFQDVHVMIFIGFGFLMTFLKKYGFSSVGYNFVLGAFVMQWGILGMHFAYVIYDGVNHKYGMSIASLVEGDFAAGAVLITMGAVLGKTSPLQLLIIALFEIVFYAANFTIGATHLQAIDMGGSMFVHTFGAYFGLALSRTISKSKKGNDAEVVSHELNGANTNSDMFAMIGTVFLWMFWPSFNGVLAVHDQQHRVVINTVMSLSACCVTAFAVDSILRPGNKFSMVSIQNATLAGGVAVGSSSDLLIQPSGAIAIGCVAGVLSVVGYIYVQPFLEKRLGLDDTCGVHNLHGMPGVLGGLAGAIAAATAGDESGSYGSSLTRVFPARAAESAIEGQGGLGRSAADQATTQVIVLVITVVMALSGGFITGMIVKCSFFLPPAGNDDGMALPRGTWYDDKHYWETEEDEEVGHSKPCTPKSLN